MKTSESVISGIEERLVRIVDNPKFFSERQLLTEIGLRNLADLHSFWLEHPELRRKLLLENHATSEKDIKKIARTGVKRIRRAWEYLTSEQLKESRVGVLGYMTPEVIANVGKYVDPDSNPQGFRESYVDSPFPYYTPKSPLLVPIMIGNLCNYIKEKDHLNPVELAAETHMRIAGIQPLKEGNKRTARLVERRILEGYGYPTSFIPYGEREIYLELLTEALRGLEKNDDKVQTPFFDYIGGKVATALDTIIDDLKTQ
jgi:Fic family protein